MVKYDAGVIRTFADRLYSRANTIVFVYTFFGLVLLGVPGFILVESAQRGSGLIGAGACGVFGALLGYFIGQGRAFMLRLAAQQALCQVQIESNTRQHADALVAA